ncbi:hypothetical protein BN1232_03200 [Mycobacterium lentiflavum]|uniref:Uncharacterized protein n=1 Tax=Mycobacterium lentiflavum TaxID=141349 RepID=A0A0E4GYU1_MYCLN|nr:hypothetical protein BN1232_03200 [Mycobacterium lentiflavum]
MAGYQLDWLSPNAKNFAHNSGMFGNHWCLVWL